MKFSKLKFSLQRIKQSSLARHTLWMFISRGLRIFAQAFYFVIIARVLGVEQYGAFIGATALVAILSPYGSLGLGNLIVKNVTINRSLFGVYWGNALFMIFASAAILTGVLIGASRIFLPATISWWLIFLVAITDLLFIKLIDISGQAFQAFHWLSRTAQLSALPYITRVLAALSLVYLFPQPDAVDWAYVSLGSTAIAAIIAVSLVHFNLGAPKLQLSRIRPEILEGFYFSIGLSAQTIYNDIDKTMLARMASLEATGIYAAAYRLIDVSFVPVGSLLAASYAKFFQQGASGITGSLKFAKKLLPLAAMYSAVAGISLFFLAPVVPYILGDEYRVAVEALRWLAPLPFLKAMHYFAADTLTGAGFQGLRSGMQIIVAIFNVLINLWIIPLYSWRGAALSSLASDSLLMLCLWLLVAFLCQKSVKKIQN
ncbi:MAG: oligosaccharide flippase family protein [Nostocaceae cyanobacterium]|nr:oligosaccharide flippase family protein [Nostocaceae cyanobacterium]